MNMNKLPLPLNRCKRFQTAGRKRNWIGTQSRSNETIEARILRSEKMVCDVWVLSNYLGLCATVCATHGNRWPIYYFSYFRFVSLPPANSWILSLLLLYVVLGRLVYSIVAPCSHNTFQMDAWSHDHVGRETVRVAILKRYRIYPPIFAFSAWHL